MKLHREGRASRRRSRLVASGSRPGGALGHVPDGAAAVGTFTQLLRLTSAEPQFQRTYVLHTEGKEHNDLPDHVQRIRADWTGGW